jgi:general secretion pathway protein G
MKNKSIKRPLARGFTLLEIIVVVTIIAVLATLIAPKLLSRVGSAKQTAAIAKASTIAKAINLYLLDEGLSAPDDNFDLEILLISTDDGGGQHGPYLERAADVIDPWGVSYELMVPGDVNASFDVISWGEDKQQGGEGAAADITQ